MKKDSEQTSGHTGVSGWLKTAGKAALAAGLLWLVFRRFPLSEVIRTLAEADVGFCLAGYLIILVSQAIQGFELGLGVRRLVPRASFPRVMGVHFIAFFYSVAIPMQFTTSVVKWYRISQGGKYRAQAAAVLIYVRTVNWFAIVVWAMPGVLLDQQLAISSLRLVCVAILGAMMVLASPLWSITAARTVRRFAKRGAGLVRVPRFIVSKAGKVWNSITNLTQMEAWRAWSLIIMALIHHALALASYYFLAHAVGADLRIPAILWLTLLIVIVQTLPISILGIGVRDATLVSILPALYGVEPSAALAFSFLLLGRQLLLCLVGGVLELDAHVRRTKNRVSPEQ